MKPHPGVRLILSTRLIHLKDWDMSDERRRGGGKINRNAEEEEHVANESG